MVVELRQQQDLEQLLHLSHKNPVVIFKHSTQCSRSADALEELNAFLSANDNVACGMLLVIEYRNLSDEVEDRFAIRHESPQAIVVVNETPVWHASHWEVTTQAIEAATEQRKASPDA